ncbi:Crp/Fnr family transcriptional regulator [Mesorhizobium sp.]|uniref:Crp/Fnr family transcriptional regulator n=1 Tax=Mesorhizobium sp. TaxID=1871066 RepID=UPI0034503AD3
MVADRDTAALAHFSPDDIPAATVAVPHSANSPYRNRLLGLLDQQDGSLLSPDLEHVELALSDRLEQQGRPINFVYFIEEGFGSIIAKMAPGRDAEAGILGHKGMTGTVVVLGDNLAPHDCVVQLAGEAMRIPIAPFHEALEQSPTLRLFLLRFVQFLMVQTSYTALTRTPARGSKAVSPDGCCCVRIALAPS